MRAFGHRAAYLTEQTLALRDDASDRGLATC